MSGGSSRSLPLHGILPIDKPSGCISKDVSRWIQRHVDKRLRLGHVGTLDPMAEGVLPLVLGWATRLQDYLLATPKSYEFTVEFGYETTTLDATGEVTQRSSATGFSAADIASVLPQFLGDILQVPPLYSAVKVGGKALYKYARGSHHSCDALPDLAALTRRVHIYALDLLECHGTHATFRVRCSKGTYVRVLAKDIAASVGGLATVVRLTRTEAAGIHRSQCISFARLQEEGTIPSAWLVRPDRIHLPLQQWILNCEHSVKRLKQGQKLLVEADRFAKCDSYKLVRSPEIQSNAGELLLVDHLGSAFGIGRFIPQLDGRFELSLRRGFGT